ncbi:hypothetical protein REPUB_Repub08aG0070700 [Reevesia pubescens]
MSFLMMEKSMMILNSNQSTIPRRWCMMMGLKAKPAPPRELSLLLKMPPKFPIHLIKALCGDVANDGAAKMCEGIAGKILKTWWEFHGAYFLIS